VTRLNWTLILYPALAVGAIGLLFGLGLGIANKLFAHQPNELVLAIRGVLPSANCGGCGFPGCEGFAEAVAAGEAKTNGCPVGGAKAAEQVAAIMGVEPEIERRVAAYVKCGGGESKSNFRYEYQGYNDCRAMALLAGGGSKSCPYGCLGMGSCVRACMFDALHYVDGIVQIDNEKCTACGMCVATCPRSLIEMVPYDHLVRVACNFPANGKVTRLHCTTGCISCKKCEKVCPENAIHVHDNLAHIDYDKCTQCGACAEACPTKVIHIIGKQLEEV